MVFFWIVTLELRENGKTHAQDKERWHVLKNKNVLWHRKWIETTSSVNRILNSVYSRGRWQVECSSDKYTEARKDTNNPPDVEIASHFVAVVWKTIDALRNHHRQLLVVSYFHCFCNMWNNIIDPSVRARHVFCKMVQQYYRQPMLQLHSSRFIFFQMHTRTCRVSE